MSPLTTLCNQALSAVEQYYAEHGLDLPERRLVSVGQEPWDCEVLSVWVVRDYPSDGGPENASFLSIRPHPGHFMRAAVLGVQVARCYPTLDDAGMPPPVLDEEDATEVIHADAEAIWRALLDASTRRAFSQPNGVSYEGWSSLGPDGGMAGGVLTCHALLPLPGIPDPSPDVQPGAFGGGTYGGGPFGG